MIAPQTKDELAALISNKVEETFNLEYKAAGAFLPDGKRKDPKVEIAKDVSSFANSSGGILIYGIKEFDQDDRKHLPERITGIDRKKFSKEWLEQVIHGNISPKIDGLHIYAIELDTVDEVAYVIEIPQSTTAHQNTADGRYYRRYDFRAVQMLDYEIRDIMNRSNFPIIELKFELKKLCVELDPNYKTARPMHPIYRSTTGREFIDHWTLRIQPFNKGKVYAQYLSYNLRLPRDIVHSDEITESGDSDQILIVGDNTSRDVVDTKHLFVGGSLGVSSIPKYGPSVFNPILPGLPGVVKEIALAFEPKLNHREIFWDAQADNAPRQTGVVLLKDIEVKTETKFFYR